MTGGPGSVWGRIVDTYGDYVQYEVDEEGLAMIARGERGFLTLDADQARLLYEAMHKYYSEEAP